MRKLKTSEIASTRAQMLEAQLGRCRLCRLPLPASKAVLDHDHETGIVRAVLHSGCNSLLGKVENNYRRYGVSNLGAFCTGLTQYLAEHSTPKADAVLHPTHRTDEEMRLLRNKRARATRAKKAAA